MKAEAAAGRGAKAPVYLLLGPEKVTKRERIAAILKQHGIEDAPQNPGRTLCFASDTPADAILAEMSTYPFFGGKKAVIVFEAEKIPRALLEGYLAEPLETTVLVLASEKAKGKFSAPLERLCEKHGQVEVFWDLFEDKLGPWAENKARREYGLSVVPGLGEFFVELCGRNMGLIEQTLQMLANRFGGEAFSLEDARRALGEQRGADVFECVGHAFSGHAGRALRHLRELLAEGESAVYIQIMLMRQAELVWRFLAGARTKEALGVQQMAFRDIQRQASGWNAAALARCIRLLAALDASLKSEPGPVQAIRLELAVLAVARKRAA